MREEEFKPVDLGSGVVSGAEVQEGVHDLRRRIVVGDQDLEICHSCDGTYGKVSVCLAHQGSDNVVRASGGGGAGYDFRTLVRGCAEKGMARLADIVAAGKNARL